MSDRFIADRRFQAEAARTAETFEGTDFGAGEKPPGDHFQEFAQPGGRPLSDKLRDLPSIGYLFDPFDPGRTSSKPFEAEPVPPARTYAFAELDVSDGRIVNTLEKAEKKARDLLKEAGRQAGCLEEEARQKAAGLTGDLTARAEAEAAELVAEAKTEAEKIKAQALAAAGDLDKMRSELEKLKSEAAGQLAELKKSQAQTQEAEKEAAALKKTLEEEKQKVIREGRLAFEKSLAEGQSQGLAQGLAKGEQEGLAQGRRDGRREVLEKAGGLLKALAKVNDLWPDLWQANGAFMVQLAVEAAEAIVCQEIENGSGLAAGAFRACVGYLHQAHEVSFRICPQDLAELEAIRSELRNEVGGLTNITFVPDAALGRGDLIMEADVGRLDATVKNRRDKVMTVLRQSLAQGLTAPLPVREEEAPLIPEAPPEAAEAAVQPAAAAAGPAPSLPPGPASNQPAGPGPSLPPSLPSGPGPGAAGPAPAPRPNPNLDPRAAAKAAAQAASQAGPAPGAAGPAPAPRPKPNL
ncbi:MAG: hypothetical protein LBK52_02455, partial [Deltaproteobacteria bacterium]|nr:hypothetical protein [Deltaproteobacteria bacterium]